MTFEEWWKKNKQQKKVEKFVKRWLKANPPNSEDEEEGGDFWHVNRMIHDGDAEEMVYDTAKDVFDRTLQTGAAGKPDQSDSLYCDLDNIIWEAHEAAMKELL